MSEFSELIKRLERVRPLLRNFYLFGYRTRNEYGEKSGRSYDNERRRIESWLQPLVCQNRGPGGKNVFISVDVEEQSRNPLYAVWKAKTFTRNDILLHFFILDLLADGTARTAEQVADDLVDRYDEFFEVSTVRLKLREYEREGLLTPEKRGRRIFYALSPLRLNELMEEDAEGRLLPALDFFTEMAPFGEVGSHLQDALGHRNEIFAFKHHFIVHTLEDEILLQLLSAIEEHRCVVLTMTGKQEHRGTPVRILTSLQNGRRYVCMSQSSGYINRRLDRIIGLRVGDVVADFEEKRAALDALLPQCWGVSILPRNERLEMLLSIDERREGYILERLFREGRGGKVERKSENVFLYTRNVTDSNEMLPFIKSFTGRILDVRGTFRMTARKFRQDMERMAKLYGVAEEAGSAKDEKSRAKAEERER